MALKCVVSTMWLKLHLAKLLETSPLLHLPVSFPSSFCSISRQCQHSPSFVPPGSTSFACLPGCTILFPVSLSFCFADSSSSHWRIHGIVLGGLHYYHSLPLSFFSLALNAIWTLDSHFYLWPQHFPLSFILILTDACLASPLTCPNLNSSSPLKPNWPHSFAHLSWRQSDFSSCSGWRLKILESSLWSLLSLVTTSSPSGNPVGSIFLILFLPNPSPVLASPLPLAWARPLWHVPEFLQPLSPAQRSPCFPPCPTEAGLSQQQSEPVKNGSFKLLLKV